MRRKARKNWFEPTFDKYFWISSFFGFRKSAEEKTVQPRWRRPASCRWSCPTWSRLGYQSLRFCWRVSSVSLSQLNPEQSFRFLQLVITAPEIFLLRLDTACCDLVQFAVEPLLSKVQQHNIAPVNEARYGGMFFVVTSRFEEVLVLWCSSGLKARLSSP